MTNTTTTAPAGLFDALTTDELKELAGALITRRATSKAGGWVGFSANRMAHLMGQQPGADQAYHDYRDIAREIGTLHSQVIDRFLALMDAR